MKILCVMGEHQYGNPNRGLGTEYSSFIPALRHLGYNVAHFESWNKRKYRDLGELNSALVETVLEERPDVVLSVQMNYEIWLETWRVISDYCGATTVNWATDDSWRYKSFSRFVGKAFDCVATTYMTAVCKYRRDDIQRVLLTQWAANPDELRRPVDASSCRYPVTFVGTAHGPRRQFVQRLGKLGIDVLCFGYGWKNGPVPMERIPEIVQCSVVSLNFANSVRGKQVKARNFEVPGWGGFLLAEHVEGLDQHYSIGQEIVTFRDLEDCADKAKYYLTHTKERDAVAQAGHERTRNEHTYIHRMCELVEFARECAPEDRCVDPNRAKQNITWALTRYRRHAAAIRLTGELLSGSLRKLWGEEKGRRIARRMLFELSWRLSGARTYSAAGLPGRLFL